MLGGASTNHRLVIVPEQPLASTARTVKTLTLGDVGIPLMTPVLGLRFNPPGSEPLEMLKTEGAAAPLAKMAVLKGRPVVSDESVLGPTLIATLRQRTGQYDQALYMIAGLMLISAVIPMIVSAPTLDHTSSRQLPLKA